MQRMISLTLVCAAACTSPSGDARDDDFLTSGKADGAISEGSPEALGVLAVVNTLDGKRLDDDVGLDARAANGIAAHRAGTDKALGTSDDDNFDTLAELDAVPYVGKTAFSKLLAYAQANGFVPASSGTWTWENPGPDGTIRTATWAVSDTDAWSVGDDGLIEHWNGATWTTVSSGVTVALTGVWASAADDVWVVGAAGTVLHYDGTAFTAVTSTTTRDLYAVHGTSKNDVWMVGDNDSQAFAGEILHWDGAQISKKRTDACPNTLYTVFASAPNDVWVGGHVKTVCHWNGSTWSEQFIQDSGQEAVTSIWRGATTTWAIYAGEAYRLDGTNWTHQYSIPRIDGGWTIPSLWRITGTSDTDLWATGTHGFLVHYDGSTWTPTRIPGNAEYASVSLTTSSEGWAVGSAARARLHNGQWTESYTAISRQWLRDAGGSSSSNIWALGTEGDILRHTSSGWAQVTSPFSKGYDFLYAVFALSPDNVWFGGSDRGGHWDGQTITLVPELANCRHIWGATANDLWAVGEMGMMAHYDGTAWTKVTSPVPYLNLFGVAGTAANDVWAIGRGTLLHYDGTSWTKVDAGLGTYEDWNDVVAIAPDDVWLAGESQSLKHFDGTTWTSMPATTNDRPWFSSAYAAGSEDVWFVLNGDGLVHWNGSMLEHESMKGAAEILGFGGHLWVTGQEGMIRRR